MIFMISWRVTPAFAVRMTITSVVFGEGASDGGRADGDCDSATAVNGYAERMNGSRNFMVAPRINELSRRLWVCPLFQPSLPVPERRLRGALHRGCVLTLEQQTERDE